MPEAVPRDAGRMQPISPTELAARLGDAPESLCIVDVREPWEREICRIEGSLGVPLGELPHALQRLDRTRPTVLVCHHGVRSAMAARHLIAEGFAEVYNLEGGVAAWADEVEPGMARY